MSVGEPVAGGEARAESRLWQRVDLPLLVVGLFIVYRGVAASAPIRTTLPAAERFFFHPSQNSPDVTLMAMVALILADWKRLTGRIGRSGPSPWAAIFLPAALALHGWSAYTQALQVDLLSIGFFLIGGALLLGGWPMARMLLLPASLLLVAIPIPVVLINQLVLPLQLGTIALTSVLLEVIGRDYAVLGDIIFSGGRAFQVIDTCTGLRSISTMFMATLVYIRVFQKRGWRAGLLLGFAVPISFFFNGIRVLSIILSADLTLAEDHTLQGIAVMIGSVLVLHAIAQGVDRVWPPEPPARPRRPAQAAPRGARMAVLLACVVVAAGIGEWVTPWQASRSLSQWAVRMPSTFEGHKASMVELDDDFLGSVEFDRHLQRSYAVEGEPPVDVLIGMQRRVGRDQSLLSHKIGSRPAHELLRDGELEVPELGGPVRVRLLRGREGARLSWSWFRGTGGLGDELLRAFFATDRSPLHREGGAWALAVSTPVTSEADFEAAGERLLRFAIFLEGQLPDGVRRGG